MKLIILLIYVRSILSIDKIRGVNLGGWLVLEPWITPSLFDQFYNLPKGKIAVDETNFVNKLGYEEAKKQLETHWSTFITEDDFIKIKEYGLNTVRIPFGWWIFGLDGYVESINHLDRGIELAKKYEIKVLLDLHGAPYSQNGFDNSGIQCSSSLMTNKCASDCPENFSWDKKKDAIPLTQEILLKIANRYKEFSNILGIQLMNEPYFTINENLLKHFYTDTYQKLRAIVPKSWFITFHDSFRRNIWSDFMIGENYDNILFDTHNYYSFSNDIINMTEIEVRKDSCKVLQELLNETPKRPLIIGEWSLGRDDCCKWLNGFMQPTRKQNMGKSCLEIYSNDFYVNFAKNQLYNYEQTAGWIFWTWKNELEPEWSYSESVLRGWLPKDIRLVDEFINSNDCIARNLKK